MKPDEVRDWVTVRYPGAFQLDGNNYQVSLSDGFLLIFAWDPEKDTFRVTVPVCELPRRPPMDFCRYLLEANYDRTYGAKYATNEGVLWCVSTHSLTYLDKKDLVHFTDEVVWLARNTGRTFCALPPPAYSSPSDIKSTAGTSRAPAMAGTSSGIAGGERDDGDAAREGAGGGKNGAGKKARKHAGRLTADQIIAAVPKHHAVVRWPRGSQDLEEEAANLAAAGGQPLDITSAFRCPISLEIMEDPVVAPSGSTYDRASIEAHLRVHAVDPFTREPLQLSDLRPNRTLKEAISAHRRVLSRQTSVDSGGSGPDSPSQSLRMPSVGTSSSFFQALSEIIEEREREASSSELTGSASADPLQPGALGTTKSTATSPASAAVAGGELDGTRAAAGGPAAVADLAAAAGEEAASAAAAAAATAAEAVAASASSAADRGESGSFEESVAADVGDGALRAAAGGGGKAAQATTDGGAAVRKAATALANVSLCDGDRRTADYDAAHELGSEGPDSLSDSIESSAGHDDEVAGNGSACALEKDEPAAVEDGSGDDGANVRQVGAGGETSGGKRGGELHSGGGDEPVGSDEDGEAVKVALSPGFSASGPVEADGGDAGSAAEGRRANHRRLTVVE